MKEMDDAVVRERKKNDQKLRERMNGYPLRENFLPIHNAANTGNNAEISRLVSDGADVDADVPDEPSYEPLWPLKIASLHGNASTVLLLLNLGADPNKENMFKSHAHWPFPKELFSDEDYLKIMKKVKELGVHLHSDHHKSHFLHGKFDSGRGSEELFEFYLNEGVNPNHRLDGFFRGRYGTTTESIPVMQQHLNHPSILKLLRSYGGDVTELFSYNQTNVASFIAKFPDRNLDIDQYFSVNTRSLYTDPWYKTFFRVVDREETIKALTEPVERKYPGFLGGSSNDPRVPSLNAKIERLESQLLACGQSLEACESEKASMRSQLYGLEDEIAAVSARLTQARVEYRDKDRTIDRLERVKVDLEQNIGVLRVAVDEGLLTTNRLNAEIEQLKEDIRILEGAAVRLPIQ